MPFSSNSTRFATTTKIFHGTHSIKGKDLSSQQIGFPQNLPYHEYTGHGIGNADGIKNKANAECQRHWADGIENTSFGGF